MVSVSKLFSIIQIVSADFYCCCILLSACFLKYPRLAQRDFVDATQFLIAERGVLQRADIVEQLLRAGRADKHGGHVTVVQQPCERHFGKRLTTFGGKVVQIADLLQTFRRQRAFLQESAVMCDAAVCGHAVEVTVREQALFERRERDEAFAELFGGFLQSVAFHSAVKNVVTVLVDDERHMQFVKDRGGFSSVGPS